jgi:hypothetical protein
LQIIGCLPSTSSLTAHFIQKKLCKDSQI